MRENPREFFDAWHIFGYKVFYIHLKSKLYSAKLCVLVSSTSAPYTTLSYFVPEKHYKRKSAAMQQTIKLAKFQLC